MTEAFKALVAVYVLGPLCVLQMVAIVALWRYYTKKLEDLNAYHIAKLENVISHLNASAESNISVLKAFLVTKKRPKKDGDNGET